MSENTMQYRGYTARIEYSTEDELLVGEVLGLKNTIIDFYGRSIDEVTQDFHNAIDSYLEVCRRQEWEPARSTALDVRMALLSDLQDRFQEQTEITRASVNDSLAETAQAVAAKTKPKKTRRPHSPRSPAAKRGKRGSSAS